MDFLDADNHLAPSLWIDAPDAEAQLQSKLLANELSESEAAMIRNFIRDGYMNIDIPCDHGILSALANELEDIWLHPPFDLAAAHIRHGRPQPMSEGLQHFRRGPGVRLLDIHSHAAAARTLYLEENVHRLCSLLFGGRAIATQSLYFEHGSMQPLHRDPWYVNHTPRSHLLAAWFALEDIHPAAGPLNYVPGSHKLPFYRFQTDDIVFHDPRVTDAERRAAVEHMRQQMQQHGLSALPALPRRGQVFLWHGSLIHGGSPVADPRMTRRSLVVHFGRADTHKRRGSTVSFNGIARTFFSTEQIHGAAGSVGWKGPLLGIRPDDFVRTVQAPTTQQD